MAELTVIWWRDIPAQVVAGTGRGAAKVQLSNRFQEAIDMAATRAGLIGSDDYMAEWHKERRECGDDLADQARAEAGRLESAYGDDRLLALARSGGVAEPPA
ncbi:MAG TPA: virulence factor [Actinomycetota bacterium]|jgi:hypothetical protein